jgi:HD domain
MEIWITTITKPRVKNNVDGQTVTIDNQCYRKQSQPYPGPIPRLVSNCGSAQIGGNGLRNSCVSDILLIARAWNFSAERHAKQKRKGEAKEPYVNHLAEVAELVATATEGRDANLVAAAVLHDTVEDTATLPAELASIFNADIADLVAEVTDDKMLSKEERKKTASGVRRHEDRTGKDFKTR